MGKRKATTIGDGNVAAQPHTSKRAAKRARLELRDQRIAQSLVSQAAPPDTAADVSQREHLLHTLGTNLESGTPPPGLTRGQRKSWRRRQQRALTRASKHQNPTKNHISNRTSIRRDFDAVTGDFRRSAYGTTDTSLLSRTCITQLAAKPVKQWTDVAGSEHSRRKEDTIFGPTAIVNRVDAESGVVGDEVKLPSKSRTRDADANVYARTADATSQPWRAQSRSDGNAWSAKDKVSPHDVASFVSQDLSDVSESSGLEKANTAQSVIGDDEGNHGPSTEGPSSVFTVESAKQSIAPLASEMRSQLPEITTTRMAASAVSVPDGMMKVRLNHHGANPFFRQPTARRATTVLSATAKSAQDVRNAFKRFSDYSGGRVKEDDSNISSEESSDSETDESDENTAKPKGFTSQATTVIESSQPSHQVQPKATFKATAMDDDVGEEGARVTPGVKDNCSRSTLRPDGAVRFDKLELPGMGDGDDRDELSGRASSKEPYQEHILSSAQTAGLEPLDRSNTNDDDEGKMDDTRDSSNESDESDEDSTDSSDELEDAISTYVPDDTRSPGLDTRETQLSQAQDDVSHEHNVEQVSDDESYDSETDGHEVDENEDEDIIAGPTPKLPRDRRKADLRYDTTAHAFSSVSWPANVGIKRRTSFPGGQHRGSDSHRHLSDEQPVSGTTLDRDAFVDDEDVFKTIDEVADVVFRSTRPLPASKPEHLSDAHKEHDLTYPTSNRKLRSADRRLTIKGVPLLGEERQSSPQVVICQSVQVPESIFQAIDDHFEGALAQKAAVNGKSGWLRTDSTSSLSDLSRTPSPPAELVKSLEQRSDKAVPSSQHRDDDHPPVDRGARPTAAKKRRMTGMTSKHFSPEKRTQRIRTTSSGGPLSSSESARIDGAESGTDLDNVTPVAQRTRSAKQETASRPKRKSTGKRSDHFLPFHLLDRVDLPTPTKSGRAPAGVSTAPVPSINSNRFGIIQEKLCNQPFWLLIAVTFLNKTAGRAAAPTFWALKDRYPTPEDLAQADQQDLHDMIHHLGLQTQRSKRLIKISEAWVANPPVAGKMYRTLHYPLKGDGKDYNKTEVIEEDARDCAGALEIGHIPGCGPYAWDSWRMFCRDTLRGVAEKYSGEGAKDGNFQPEWQRVLPLDKELRATLRWMWLREGWIWNHETGEKRRATAEEMEKAVRGEMEVADAGELKFAVQAVASEQADAPVNPSETITLTLAERPGDTSAIELAKEPSHDDDAEISDNILVAGSMSRNSSRRSGRLAGKG